MYAHVTNGIVDFVIEANPLAVFGQKYASEFIECQSNVQVGWCYENGVFEPCAPAPDPVPQTVTRRQGQLMLLQIGLLDDVEAAINAIADPIQKRTAQIEYEADTWERQNAFLSDLWIQLGGTSESLDDAFRQAVTL